MNGFLIGSIACKIGEKVRFVGRGSSLVIDKGVFCRLKAC